MHGWKAFLVHGLCKADRRLRPVVKNLNITGNKMLYGETCWDPDNHQKFWWAMDVASLISTREFLQCNPLFFGTWREGNNVARPAVVVNPFSFAAAEIFKKGSVVKVHCCSEILRRHNRYGCKGQRNGVGAKTATHERMIKDMKTITLPGEAREPPPPPRDPGA